ncbi:MAG: TolC family protein [Candidatus Gastranaerophilales bacterium]|nr:TolC family protein [Candidatus Gastranaerophilales bacterium]
MKKIFGIILALAVIFISTTVFAEELGAVQKPVDFNEAILIALENNKELMAMKAALSASEKDIGISRSYLLPRVSFGEDFASTNNPAQVFGLKLNQRRLTSADFAGAPGSFNNPGNITNFMTYGLVQVPVFNKTSLVALKISKTQYSANAHVYLRKQDELIKNVAQNYLQTGTAQEYVKAAQQGVKDAQEHLRIAQLRYKSELGLYSDVLRAKTELSEAQQRLVSANKNLEVAKRSLGMLLGRKTNVEISNNTPVLDLKTIDYYKDFMLQRNDLKALEINVQNAKNGVRLAQADWFPTLNLNASYNLYQNNYPFGAEGNNYVMGAYLHWDAFDGMKRNYETKKAKDKVQEAEFYLEALKNAIDFKVFEAFSGVEESNKNFELAQIALLTAQEGNRLVTKRWQSSLSPFVDVLDSQTNLDRARANLVKSNNELKAQLINLYFESGVLNEELALNTK